MPNPLTEKYGITAPNENGEWDSRDSSGIYGRPGPGRAVLVCSCTPGEISINEHRIQNAKLIAKSPKMLAELENARAVIDLLMFQIHQMKGLFGDEDGAIAAALEDGGETWTSITNLLNSLEVKR